MATRGPLEAVASIATELHARGFEPVLVGGMALVLMGSQRVTKDFDLLVSARGPAIKDLVDVVYRHGLELVTKFGPTGEVERTVDSRRVALLKVNEEAPRSLFFYGWKARFRLDILLDFPVPAPALARRATNVKVKAHRLPVASPEDLLKLKELAYADRKLPSDAQDLEFLRRVLTRPAR